MDVIWFRNTGRCGLQNTWNHTIPFSDTLDDLKEDVTCTDVETMDIHTKFQTWSHSTATSVYQTMQDITSVKSSLWYCLF